MQDFPYKRLFCSTEEVLQKFEQLKQIKPDIITSTRGPRIKMIRTNNSYSMGIILKNDFVAMPYAENCNLRKSKKFLIFNLANCLYDLDMITDVFTEYARVSARLKSQELCLYDYYNKNKEIILEKVGDDPKAQREYLYKTVPEVTQFKISRAIEIIRFFGATSVLDFCSGWGDRLIAAIATDCFYTGIDPNINLKRGYLEILDTFVPENKRENYDLNFCTAQDYFANNKSNKKYDLILTSPPFYDFEIYADDPSQSHNLDVESWFNDFLMFSIFKAWDRLATNGTMVLYVCDIKLPNNTYFPLLERMISLCLQQCNGCIYRGAINDKKLAFHVFRKF
jgi:hypothetical protein